VMRREQHSLRLRKHRHTVCGRANIRWALRHAAQGSRDTPGVGALAARRGDHARRPGTGRVRGPVGHRGRTPVTVPQVRVLVRWRAAAPRASTCCPRRWASVLRARVGSVTGWLLGPVGSQGFVARSSRPSLSSSTMRPDSRSISSSSTAGQPSRRCSSGPPASRRQAVATAMGTFGLAAGEEPAGHVWNLGWHS
jgi:hypothetical protein